MQQNAPGEWVFENLEKENEISFIEEENQDGLLTLGKCLRDSHTLFPYTHVKYF